MKRADKAIYKALGHLPNDFRPPYGAVNPEVAQAIGKPLILWSVDSEDWKSRNTKGILKRVMTTVYNHSIVLLHDIHPETVAAISQLIDSLENAGYEIVSQSKLFGTKPKPLFKYYSSENIQPVG